MSVRLSACRTVAVIGRLSLKFDIGNLYENVSRKSVCGVIRAKIPGTLQEDPVASLLLPATLTDEQQTGVPRQNAKSCFTYFVPGDTELRGVTVGGF